MVAGIWLATLALALVSGFVLGYAVGARDRSPRAP